MLYLILQQIDCVGREGSHHIMQNIDGACFHRISPALIWAMLYNFTKFNHQAIKHLTVILKIIEK